MFSKLNISDLPIEKTAHATGSRKSLAQKTEVLSEFFEAYTYGFLPAGETWEMHLHENIVEIGVVVKGTGKVKDADKNAEKFAAGDRFIFPPNTLHEITNTGNESAEFYFTRLRSI